MLALTRQNLPQYAETGEGAYKGGYILKDAPNGKPDVILMASGSEVELIYKAAELLAAEGIAARVVSMPCLDLFDEQPEAAIPGIRSAERSVRARVAVEAASAYSWDRYVGLDGNDRLPRPLRRFRTRPASSFKEFGFTVETSSTSAKAIRNRISRFTRTSKTKIQLNKIQAKRGGLPREPNHRNTNSVNPYHNLALEEVLFDSAGRGGDALPLAKRAYCRHWPQPERLAGMPRGTA